MQRTEVDTGRQLFVPLFGRSKRRLAHHRQEGIEARIETLDRCERLSHELRGGDLFCAQQGTRFEDIHCSGSSKTSSR